MDNLQIIAVSSKSGFPLLIREHLQSHLHPLPPFQVDHLSSLEEEIPENLQFSARVLLLDLESLGGRLGIWNKTGSGEFSRSLFGFAL